MYSIDGPDMIYLSIVVPLYASVSCVKKKIFNAVNIIKIASIYDDNLDRCIFIEAYAYIHIDHSTPCRKCVGVKVSGNVGDILSWLSFCSFSRRKKPVCNVSLISESIFPKKFRICLEWSISILYIVLYKYK